MTGEDVTEIVSNAGSLRDIALDVVSERIYWTVAGGTIKTVSFDGTDQRDVYSSDDLELTALTVFEDYIYCTAPSSNGVVRVDKHQREGVRECVMHHAQLKELWHCSAPCDNSSSVDTFQNKNFAHYHSCVVGSHTIVKMGANS